MWRLYYNEIFKINIILVIFWSFYFVKEFIFFIKDKINCNYRKKIFYIEVMYENLKKLMKILWNLKIGVKVLFL